MSRLKPFSTSLGEHARKLGMTSDQLRDWLTARGYTDKDIEDAFSPTALKGLVEPVVERLLPKASTLLGWPPSQFAGRITIEVENIDTVECHVAPVAGATDKYVLRVPAGFLFFVHKVVYALANGLLKDQGPPILQATNEAALLLKAFYGRTRLRRQQAWAIQPYQLTTQQRYLIAFLVGYIREAVVAHELGHIVHELGTSPSVQVLTEDLIGLQLKNRSWIDALPLLAQWAERRRQPWINEFAADRLAIFIMGRPDGREFAPCHGLIVLLFIIEMLEWCGGKKVYDRASHPPSTARRGMLWKEFPWLANNTALPLFDSICRDIARAAGCKPPEV